MVDKPYYVFKICFSQAIVLDNRRGILTIFAYLQYFKELNICVRYRNLYVLFQSFHLSLSKGVAKLRRVFNSTKTILKNFIFRYLRPCYENPLKNCVFQTGCKTTQSNLILQIYFELFFFVDDKFNSRSL